jgi:hypothetical protein
MADDCPMVSGMPFILRPVEPRNRLEPADEFRLYAHASIISFKDDTFPLKCLRLPDVPSRLKVPQYCRSGSISPEAKQPHRGERLRKLLVADL